MNIRREQIIEKALIERRFFGYLTDDNYEIDCVSPLELLTPNRFDLFIKLYYLKKSFSGGKYHQECYQEHIKAFSLGGYAEPENKGKKNIDDFYREFELVSNSIKIEGFDATKSLVPLASDGSILNGAHRVAAAAFHGKKVYVIRLPIEPRDYSYDFFKKRCLPPNILCTGLVECLSYRNNLRAALVWPSANNSAKGLFLNSVKNVIACENYTLPLKELAALIRQVYKGEAWLGCPKNGYAGTYRKAADCYGKGGKLSVIFFVHVDGCLVELKEAIRSKLSLGKHSIHISDAVSDTKDIINSILNPNNLIHYAHEKHSACLKKEEKLMNFREKILLSGADLDRVAIDTGFAMEIFGIRESSDIDIVSDLGNDELSCLINLGVGLHNEEFLSLGYHVSDLIDNPRNYFHYNGFKFISLDLIREIKLVRGKQKDKNDVALIESMISGARNRFYISYIKQKILFSFLRSKKRIRFFLVSLTKFFGVYDFIRKIVNDRRG